MKWSATDHIRDLDPPSAAVAAGLPVQGGPPVDLSPIRTEGVLERRASDPLVIRNA